MFQGLFSIKGLCLSVLAFISFNATAQVFDVPATGSDTSTSCFGLLRDPGGNANYSGYQNGYFVIDPPGNGPVSVLFSSFNTQSFSDYVSIYDGPGLTGTLLGTYSGATLPAGGLAITSTSGAITVKFQSNCCTHYSGFVMSWTASSTPPVASFAVNTSPAYNTPVQFINTSINGGTYLWEFGDGQTSTLINPVHNYTIAGPKQARLIVSNCGGSDTSLYTTINVQAAPIGAISTDTVKMTLPCGTTGSTSFTVSNSGAGILNYGLQLTQKSTNSTFREDFEGSGLGAFTNLNTTSTTATIQSTGAPQGSKYLSVVGSGFIDQGLRATMSSSQPEYIAYRIKDNSYTSYHGYVRFIERSPAARDMFYSVFRYNDIRLYYKDVNNYNTYYLHPRVQGTWYNIELKNIDWTTQSYDIYIDGVAVVTGARFLDNTITGINEVDVHHSSFADVDIDDFRMDANDLLSLITYNPKSGTLSNGNSNVIFINASAANLNAGVYWLQFVISSNDTALDGLIVPLRLEVTGTAILSQSANCINFGTTFTGFQSQDSVLLSNSGCDTLDFNAISSSHADITTSPSSMQLAPGDSTYIYVSLNSSSPQTYTDTIYLNGPDTNATICINAVSVGAPVVSTDSTGYNIYYTGCGDSVSFPLTVYNTGLGNLNWATSSSVNANVSDDFENPVFKSSLWASWGVSAFIGSNCSVINGSGSLNFYGAGQRYVTTVPLNTTSGGTIEFTLNQGSCEYADGGEGIYVDYSLNGGATWFNIGYYYTTSGNLLVSAPIPAQAQANNVIFRLEQRLHSGSGFDNFVVDDFSISSSISNSIVFKPDTGSIAPGDSVLMTGTIGIQGLTTGTYNLQGYIVSNDPSNPIYSFPVNLYLIGIPDISVQSSCFDMDTVMTGANRVDSVMVINEGCGDLVISGLTTATTNFTVQSSLSTIAPGDTSYVQLQFSGSSTLGVINDTLSISSNDTLVKLCLSGYTIGAPVAIVRPDSIYASFTSCNDSVTVPITLVNSGLSSLWYQVLGQASSTVNVVLYQPSSNFNEYSKVKTIVSQMMDVNLIESFATSSFAITSDLATADVIIIPEGGALPAAVIPSIRSFVSGGGTCIHLSNSYYNINQVGIFTTNGATGAGGTINVVNGSHPIMTNIGSTLSYQSATTELSITSAHTVLASNFLPPSNYAMVAASDYGNGHGVFIGYDYYSYNQVSIQLLGNAIRWGAKGKMPDYISVSPDSGTVATSDSVTINVTLRSLGLNNGRDTTTLVFETNDPLKPTISIPVVIDVMGTSETQLLYSGCMDFDSLLVGAARIDSLYIRNVGCDSLIITGASSSSGDFTLLSLPAATAPGDSVIAFVKYVPSTIGLTNDTLFFFGNADTVGLCVTGRGLGAPQAIVTPDTLRINVNKCDGISLQTFSIQNTGQGNMSYDVRLSEQYVDTSRAFFNTSGAATTHSFANTPSTTDTIWFMVAINGDFDGNGEDISVIVEGITIQTSLSNNVTIGINDSLRFFYVGPNIATWLADNTLNVTIQNTSSVNPGFANALDMHFVEVRMGGVGPAWLTMLSPSTGSLAIGNTVSKSLAFDPGSLLPGVYTTTINVLSDDPINPIVPLYVEFTVEDKAEIVISDTCLIFPTTLIGDTTTTTFWIYNEGCKNLSIGSIISPSNTFKVSPANGSVLAGDSLLITVNFIPSSINAFNSNLIINNNDSTILVCLIANSNALPVADFAYSVENVCKGELLFNNSSQYSPTAFYWDFGDGTTSTLPTVTHFFPQPGTYKVFFRAVNSAGFDTISKLITVSPFVGDFDLTNDTMLVNTPVNFYDSTVVANKWTWTFGDGNGSSVQNPVHSYTAVGSYNVDLVAEDSRNCQLTISKTIYIVDGIGISEYMLDGINYSVFPNPSEGRMTIEAMGINWNGYQFRIVDGTGRIIKLIDPSGFDRTQMDLTGVRAGVYQLIISKDGALKTRRNLIIK